MLARLDQVYASWHKLLTGTTEESLQEHIGQIGGVYGESARRSFAPHTATPR